MKKTPILIFVLILAACLLSGCLRDNNGSNNENPVKEDGKEQIEEDEKKQSEDMEKERVAKTGIYIGEIDDNSIKIKVEDEPISFILTDQTKKEAKELKENEKIDFVYYNNPDGQFVLAGITKKYSDKEAPQVAKGIYTGRLDNFSIEVQIGEGHKVFINYEMDKILEGIEEGDEVEVKYTENEHGQLELESLKKTN